MRLILFLIIGQIILNGLLLWVVWRATDKESIWRKISKAWVVMELFGFVMVFCSRAIHGGSFARGGFTPFFNYFIFVIVLLLLVSIGYGGIALFNRLLTDHKDETSMKKQRGIVLLVLITLTIILCIQGYYNTMLPNVQRYDIVLTSGTHSKRNIKIALVTDMHIGGIIQQHQVQHLVNLLQKESPDYVFLGGDQLDYYYSYISQDSTTYTDLMQRLHPRRDRIFSILGNHEYYIDTESKLRWFQSFSTLLKDSVVALDDDLYLIGRDDAYNTNRLPLSELTKGIPPSAIKILLSHQPKDPEEEQINGIDLALHGHTHRGQFIPFSWLMHLFFDNPYGYKQVGRTHYITSSGYGVSTSPIRIGTKSEIVIINLTIE